MKEILELHRNINGGFDCVVPVSGGKDGSYVAHKLKNDFGMNILTVTVTPPLSLELGDLNLRNFIDSGFNHLKISPDPEAMRILNRIGFIEKGFPYYGWLISIQAAVVRTAVNLVFRLFFMAKMERLSMEVQLSRKIQQFMMLTICVEFTLKVDIVKC